jgi:hypothetical protein
MKLTFLILLTMLGISVTSLTVRAQGICIHDSLRVSRVAGRVVAQLDKGETPLHDITVKVLSRNGRVIARAVTGEDGLFDLTRKIKPGEYVLDVSYKRLLATYKGKLIVERIKPNAPAKEIVVTLGADFVRPCGGTHVELKSVSYTPTRANKSLDASGGSVFRNMTGPAMLE